MRSTEESIPSTTAEGRKPGRLWWLFLAGSIANAWPLAAYFYVPFQDHPSTLLRANVICKFADPDLRYSNYFEVNPNPVGNVLADYLTVAFSLLVSIDLAGRVTAAIYVVLLPLTVWFWIARTAPGREAWAVLAWPLVWSRFCYYGNWNFCIGVCLLFYLLGLLAGWNRRPRGLDVLACTVAATLAYFAHFYVFLIAGLALLIHLLLRDPRSLRNWIEHALIVLPGLLCGVVWYFRTEIEHPGVTDWGLDWRAIAFGIYPSPWAIDKDSTLWGFLGLGVMALILIRAVYCLKHGNRLPSILIMSFAVIALVFPRWLIIIFPGARLWWIILLASLCLLPATGKIQPAVWLAGLALGIGTSIANARQFDLGNQAAIMAEQAFAEFPPRLRLAYIGYPDLPRALHRCFEYYHLRHGGVGPYHAMAGEWCVRYRGGRPPAADIYSYGVSALGPWLNAYDAILLVAPPTEQQEATEMLNALRRDGWVLKAPLPFALLIRLQPQAVAAPSVSYPPQRESGP